jgi:hypothetical protein
MDDGTNVSRAANTANAAESLPQRAASFGAHRAVLRVRSPAAAPAGGLAPVRRARGDDHVHRCRGIRSAPSRSGSSSRRRTPRCGRSSRSRPAEMTAAVSPLALAYQQSTVGVQVVRADAERVAPAGWREWLAELFPMLGVNHPMAPHHVQFWEHIWSIDYGSAPRPFFGVWSREGGKSTNVELASAALGVRGRRRYIVYVRQTQEAADNSVANIKEKLESSGDRAVLSARIRGRCCRSSALEGLAPQPAAHRRRPHDRRARSRRRVDPRLEGRRRAARRHRVRRYRRRRRHAGAHGEETASHHDGDPAGRLSRSLRGARHSKPDHRRRHLHDDRRRPRGLPHRQDRLRPASRRCAASNGIGPTIRRPARASPKITAGTPSWDRASRFSSV